MPYYMVRDNKIVILNYYYFSDFFFNLMLIYSIMRLQVHFKNLKPSLPCSKDELLSNEHYIYIKFHTHVLLAI